MRYHSLEDSSRRHSLIAGNIYIELTRHLRDGAGEAHVGMARVRVAATGLEASPDVVAVSGEPTVENGAITNPELIVEVLSNATEAYDRGEKFAHYRRLESLREYVVVSHDCMHVERFDRWGKEWRLADFSGVEAMLPLESVGCTISLRDIYRRVDFESSGD